MTESEQLIAWTRHLDDVTAAYLVARKGAVLSPYEADRAGAWLTHAVFIHGNAFSTLAGAQSAIAHAPVAWLIARAAFETAVTAVWLCVEDDWVERESRFLGWITGHEDHLTNMCRDLSAGPTPPSELVDRFRTRAGSLKDWRLAVTAKLPKDSRMKRPSLFDMLREIEMDRRYYTRYRIGSTITHASPAAAEHFVTHLENGFEYQSTQGFSTWTELFRMVSWSISQATMVTLPRAGVAPEALEAVLIAHDQLLEAVGEG